MVRHKRLHTLLSPVGGGQIQIVGHIPAGLVGADDLVVERGAPRETGAEAVRVEHPVPDTARRGGYRCGQLGAIRQPRGLGQRLLAFIPGGRRKFRMGLQHSQLRCQERAFCAGIPGRLRRQFAELAAAIGDVTVQRRLGWRSLDMVLDSICRMRSRVTPYT
ncbi:Uncharacterised protein [Mycobacteroides abscessus subsp. abscessus]|nr:Uncharacterised protein [Mycobacteroides abscessus subsp. abscessus]